MLRIGRGEMLARAGDPDHPAPITNRLARAIEIWVQTCRGFGRLFKQAAGRPSSLGRPPSASKRRRLEPPLCRPLARHRAVSRQLHYGFTRFHSKSAVGSHAQLAARRRLGRASRSIVTPSDHARTTIASIASVSDRSEGPRANALADRFDRRDHGFLNPGAITGVSIPA